MGSVVLYHQSHRMDLSNSVCQCGFAGYAFVDAIWVLHRPDFVFDMGLQKEEIKNEWVIVGTRHDAPVPFIFLHSFCNPPIFVAMIL